MPDNPFVEQRKMMKMQLFNLMKRNPEIPEDRIIAIFSLKTGLKEKTCREYLRELKAALDMNAEKDNWIKEHPLSGQKTLD